MSRTSTGMAVVVIAVGLIVTRVGSGPWADPAAAVRVVPLAELVVGTTGAVTDLLVYVVGAVGCVVVMAVSSGWWSSVRTGCSVGDLAADGRN